MAVTSKIVGLKPKTSEAQTFPWLGRLAPYWAEREGTGDYTILFYGPPPAGCSGAKGLVVQSGSGASYPVGYHSDGWLVERFEPTDKRVKLNNAR